MRKIETREVEVKYCDFCGEETDHLTQCTMCGQEMCSKNGSNTHQAYTLEVRRYKDGQRSYLKICKNCAVDPCVTRGESISSLIEKMMEPRQAPRFTPSQPEIHPMDEALTEDFERNASEDD
ncbi:MAG: hypothetical protein Q8O98_01965 [bacterium]|nr:hypothetical protein [bacterium]